LYVVILQAFKRVVILVDPVIDGIRILGRERASLYLPSHSYHLALFAT